MSALQTPHLAFKPMVDIFAQARFVELMRSLPKNDPEAAGSVADALLCDLVRQCGYGDVVDAYNAVDKL